MKAFLHLSFVIPLVLMLYSCQKNDEPEEETSKVKVYYSYNDSKDILLSDEDTITIKLADTFSLKVDISNDYKILEYFIGNTKPFDFIDNGNYNYQFTTIKSGVFPLSVLAYRGNDDNDYITITFNVKVPTINYTIFALEDPIYTVNVEDDNLKNTIQTELQNSYFLKLWPLKLECNTLTGGDYQLKLKSVTGSFSGTFTTTNVFNVTDFKFTYNNLTYSYALTLESGNISSSYQFKQDLTEAFKAKYPDKSINEVSLTFEGIRVKG
jgi:hypothetical protein